MIKLIKLKGEESEYDQQMDWWSGSIQTMAGGKGHGYTGCIKGHCLQPKVQVQPWASTPVASFAQVGSGQLVLEGTGHVEAGHFWTEGRNVGQEVESTHQSTGTRRGL